jgi:hypothetical protein
MRNTIAWLALVGVLGFALGGSVIYWSFNRPPYHRYHPPTETQYDKTPEEDKPSFFFSLGAWADDWHDAIGALSAIGILAFTGVLMWSTIMLWIATTRIVSSAEENSRTIERAYISGGGVTILQETLVIRGATPVIEPLGDQFQVRIANHGKTAARLTGVWWNFQEIASIWNEEPDYASPHPFDDMVMPGTADRPLFVVDIPDEIQHPVVIIRYTYLDVWGGEHESRFINAVFRDRAIPAQIVAPEAYTRLT